MAVFGTVGLGLSNLETATMKWQLWNMAVTRSDNLGYESYNHNQTWSVPTNGHAIFTPDLQFNMLLVLN